MFAAASWYDERRAGTGTRFLSEVERYLEIIHAHPGVGTLIHDRRARELRAMLMRSFPYRIIYRHLPNLLVVAIAHTSRRPGYWRSRL
jgi:hypothetical protein